MKKFIFSLTILSLLFCIFLFYPIKETSSETQWIFYDRNGEILFSEKPYFQSSSEAQKTPELFEQGIIAIEDQDFYTHTGIDFSSLFRATKQNIQEQKVVSGASTITMQLAKLMFLEGEKRNFWYKIRQILYALKLEIKFSKEEILEKYISKINFGTGSTGLTSAANRYFSKTPETLSVGEIATLIGSIQNPSAFNPLTQPKKSEIRKNLILDILTKRKIISSQDQIFWKNEPIKLNIQIQDPIHAPHFVFWVKSKINNEFLPLVGGVRGGKELKELHVHTTLDKQLYQKLLNIIHHEIKNNKQKNNAHNAGLVAIDLNSNEIRAMIGSVDFFDKNIDGAVNMTTSKRSTGSVLKPFLYALALEEGFSPSDEIQDTAKSFPAGEGRYMPRNFNVEKEYGSVRFREALTNSYNLSAVNLLNQIGIKKFIKKLNQVALDIGTEDDLGLSAILGSGEESLLNLTSAYTIFPNEGIFEKPKFLIDIKDENGISLFPRHREALTEQEKIQEGCGDLLHYSENRLPRSFPTCNSTTARNDVLRPFTTSTSNWITHALSDEKIRWKNFKQGNVLEVDHPAGVKTGTSQEFKDNWTIGFSPDFALGVWVGNARGAPLHTSSGVEGAGTIWNKTFRFLHKDLPEKNFTYNSNRKEITICRRPYEQDNCSEKMTEFLLPEEIQNSSTSKNPKFSIAFPLDGDIFHKDSEILLKVRNTPNNSKIQYFLDGKSTTNHLSQLPSGRHTIWAKCNEILTDEIEFFVEE